MTIPTVLSGSYNPSYTIPKLGTISLTFRTCPYQPTTNATLKGPRFHGYDGTGCYFGANGYYQSIPVWQPWFGGYSAYQLATFSLNESGAYLLSALQANPFAKHAALAVNSPQGGQLPFPLPLGSSVTVKNTPSTVTQGLGTIYLGAAYGYQYYNVGSYQESSWPALTFENLNLSFQSTPLANFGDITESFCGNPLNVTGIQDFGQPSFLIYDIVGRKFKHFSHQITNYAPCGASRQTYAFKDFCAAFVNGGNNGSPDTQNPFAPYAEVSYVRREQGNLYAASVPTYFGFGGGLKVAPNGNFCSAGYNGAPSPIVSSTAYIYIGNVLSPISGQITNPTITRGWVARANLSDPTDQAVTANMGLASGIQQVAGGGFLVFDYSAFRNVFFYILPDFSGYIKINAIGLPSISYTAENVAIDLNGIMYFMNYSGSSFLGMLYSGPPTQYVSLSLPQLTQLGVSCKHFDYLP